MNPNRSPNDPAHQSGERMSCKKSRGLSARSVGVRAATVCWATEDTAKHDAEISATNAARATPTLCNRSPLERADDCQQTVRFGKLAWPCVVASRSAPLAQLAEQRT